MPLFDTVTGWLMTYVDTVTGRPFTYLLDSFDRTIGGHNFAANVNREVRTTRATNSSSGIAPSDVRALRRGQGGLRATAEEHVPRRLGVRAALGCRAVAGCSRRELAALRRRSMADVFGVGLAIGGRGAISEFALGSAQPGQCPDGFPRAALQARRSRLGQG